MAEKKGGGRMKNCEFSLKVKKGDRIRLLASIEDPYTPKEAGDTMVVSYVDDAGQIHGTWESGGSIAVIVGVDRFEII